MSYRVASLRCRLSPRQAASPTHMKNAILQLYDATAYHSVSSSTVVACRAIGPHQEWADVTVELRRYGATADDYELFTSAYAVADYVTYSGTPCSKRARRAVAT